MATSKRDKGEPQDPRTDHPLGNDELPPLDDAAVEYIPDEDEEMPSSETERVLRKHETKLLSIEGVTGAGVTTNRIGEDVIVVYLHGGHVASRVPKELDGVPVETEITGDIDAL